MKREFEERCAAGKGQHATLRLTDLHALEIQIGAKPKVVSAWPKGTVDFAGAYAWIRLALPVATRAELTTLLGRCADGSWHETDRLMYEAKRDGADVSLFVFPYRWTGRKKPSGAYFSLHHKSNHATCDARAELPADGVVALHQWLTQSEPKE